MYFGTSRVALRTAACTMAVLLSWGRLADAQSGGETGRAEMSRDELTKLLEQYEAASASDAYSAPVRAQARMEAALISSRLREGDFRVGDRILLTVENEPEISGEHVVASGPRLVLPQIGDVPLEGVLRSELRDHIANALARYIRRPVVHVQSSLRLSVLGEVDAPGFYVFPSSALLTDVLNGAGGPTREARLDEIRIERGEERIWYGAPLQQAIVEGRTLDQLGLRAGDVIVVPGEGIRKRDVLMGTLGALPSIYVLVQLVRYLGGGTD